MPAPIATPKTLKRGKVKLGAFRRELNFKLDTLNFEARTVEVEVSSETAVERWYGNEILDHASTSVMMARLNNGAALLFNHDPNLQIGVVVRNSAKIVNKRIVCTVIFSKSELGQEKLQDVQDGILTKISVGYRVHKLQFESEEQGQETYRALLWEPYEVSFVSIAADDSVGARALRNNETETENTAELITQETTMLRRFLGTLVLLDPDPANNPGGGAPAPVATPPAPAPGVRSLTTADVQRAVQLERARSTQLDQVQQRFGHIAAIATLVSTFRANDQPLEVFNTEFMNAIRGADVSKPIATPELGLNDKEKRRFSFVRAINAVVNGGNWRGAEFEKEVHDGCEKMAKRSTTGFFVPREILMQRDLVAGTGSAGGFVVATELKTDSFIELLRNKMVLKQLGAIVIGGLEGNVEIPKQTGTGQAYWVGESSDPTGSQLTLGQIAMTPKTVGAYTDLSRKLLLQQSLDMELLVRSDLALILALAIDYAGLRGSGSSSQPLGLLNTTGIGAIIMGTNGGALNWANIVNFESQIAANNADISTMGFLTSPLLKGKLKTTLKDSVAGAGYLWSEGGEMNGYKAVASNQVPANLTKGSGTALSELYFGNWADILVGEWGVLDVQLDPYAKGLQGASRIRLLQDVDVTVRRAESFVVCQDAVTA